MSQRVVIEIGAALIATLLLAFNLRATRQIWTSPEIERSQMIAQTILVWFLPGAFLAIRYELDPPCEPKNDPTVPKVTDNPSHALGQSR